jgi:hypothetical protein
LRVRMEPESRPAGSERSPRGEEVDLSRAVPISAGGLLP